MILALVILSSAVLALGALVWALSQRLASGQAQLTEALASRQAAEALREEAGRRESEALATLEKLRELLRQAGEQVAKATAESAEREKSLVQTQASIADLRKIFKADASEALSASQGDFIKMAEERLKPLSEQIDKLRNQHQQVEARGAATQGELKSMVEILNQGQLRLSQATLDLTNALANNQTAGELGEMALTRLLEWAGLKEGMHYSTQVQVKRDSDILKPDLVLHLPGDRDIIIDSKAVLNDYLAAANESDPEKRNALLKSHAARLKITVDQLGKKEYFSAFVKAPDFVVLFLPNDAILLSATQQDPELLPRALEKKVILSGPGMLIPLLKVVEKTWTQAQMAANAEDIVKGAQMLIDRMQTFLAHAANLSQRLKGSNAAFNEMVGSLDRNVYPALERFRLLGVKGSKELKGDEKPTVIDETPDVLRITQMPTKVGKEPLSLELEP